MNFTLHQLLVFYQVVQTKSITKAAEALHLSQPAISIQLKNFQQQFDFSLTEVVGRKLYVTDFGKDIAIVVEGILNQLKTIDYKTSQRMGKLAGTLKISVVSTGKYIMPYFLTKFLANNTEVNLVLDITNKQKVFESIEKNEVDFSLVSVLPKLLQVNKITLMENKLFFVGNTQQAYTNKMYNLNILSKLPILYREAGSGTRQTMELFIKKSKLTVQKKLELNSNEGVKQAIMAGLGFSIMPLIGLKNELINKDLQIIPVKGLPLKTEWNLIWLRTKKLSPVAAAYLAFLKVEKQNIINEKFDWVKNYE